MAQTKKVNMKMIAEALDVSIVTVSNALNDRKGVSDDMKKQILAKAKELGYVLKEAKDKVNPASGTGQMIGVVVAERYVKLFPSFYMEIYKNIADEAMKTGKLTMLEVVTSEKENLEQPFLAFMGNHIDGIIMIGEFERAYMEAAREACRSIPMVCIDYYDIYEDVDYVLTNSFAGVERMTRLLLKNGITDLMFVGSVGVTKSITDRYLGFCKALTRMGYDDAACRVIPDRDEQGNFIELQLPERLPKGFVCNCDRTAYSLYHALVKRGVRVPEDVSIVGFDNFPRDSTQPIRLTTYRNDEKVLARLGMHVMNSRLEQGIPAGGGHIVEGGIVHGESVKFIKDKVSR